MRVSSPSAVLTLAALLATLGGSVFAHPGGLDKNGCHVESQTQQRHCHGKRANRAPEGVPHPGEEGVLNGVIQRVIDGDTLVVKIQGAAMTFRLSEIDAPELDQPYGREARQALALLVGLTDDMKPEAVMRVVEADGFGRTVVHLFINGKYINGQMVSGGHAWFDSEYANSDVLFGVENEARSARIGLWAAPAAKLVEPWEWRRRKRSHETR